MAKVERLEKVGRVERSRGSATLAVRPGPTADDWATQRRTNRQSRLHADEEDA